MLVQRIYGLQVGCTKIKTVGARGGHTNELYYFIYLDMPLFISSYAITPYLDVFSVFL